MINVHDNRNTNERQLHTVEPHGFFMLDGTLYRRCWWDVNTFNTIKYKDACFTCMNMTDGELVLIRHDEWVQPIADRQIELSVED